MDLSFEIFTQRLELVNPWTIARGTAGFKEYCYLKPESGGLTGWGEAMNRRVYQELFLTPDYDAWLGLVPEDTYTGIEKDGCACDKGALPMRQSK
jgi:hypothetical protein